MKDVWTTARIRKAKGGEKIVCLTAYDSFTARLLDEAGVHLILVGDSLGMAVLGYETTLPVTLEQIIHHTAAVARGVRQALVVADLPFLTYQVTVAQAVESAGRCLKEGGAQAVKLEGGAGMAPTVKALVDTGIPVLGHVGLLPQRVHAMGGYKVQGRQPGDADRLMADARALEQAGAFALVLEGLPAAVAGRITASIGIPTIGIGAGPQCDGQILVVNDMLGMTGSVTPKFVRRYARVGDAMRKAFAAYARDVNQGRFPARRESYRE